jgi:hypothetical protein
VPFSASGHLFRVAEREELESQIKRQFFGYALFRALLVAFVINSGSAPLLRAFPFPPLPP